VILRDTSSVESTNGSDTGGSIASETCVAAALNACAKLAAALEPFRASGSDWTTACAAAVAAGVELVATGWFVQPVAAGQEAGWEFDYATQGVCYAEAEVDTLTGESCVRKLYVAMDQGTSLNPLVDLGQVEGALIMSLGYFMTEEVCFADDGSPLTLGCWEYKPPAIHDLPLVLNVKFMDAVPNPSSKAVLGSKASGEPAMALGAACALAVRNAVSSARRDVGISSPQLDLVLPLTVERVQRSCFPGALPPLDSF
jgi:xanthine dehydrogenase/oxidase